MQRMQTDQKLKKEIIEIGYRMWLRGFIAANDGNISALTAGGKIITTPTGVSKGFMQPEMLLLVNREGLPVRKNNPYRISSEFKMHLEVYNQRKDVMAVVHAHPPYCTAFSVAGIALDHCVLPEAVVSLGAIPVAEYATPSTEEIPLSIRPHIQNSDVILLQNHGLLCVGKSLQDAYFKLETAEHSAKIMYLSMNLGNVQTLNEEQVDKLMQLRSGYGMSGKITSCKTGLGTEQVIRETIEEIKKPPAGGSDK
ncbi:MAG: class II aldolase/adducin family protein [Calditrichaeota bacterium]|nr:MAG: class II aldolase/adducin family protein [Calditrichota bacterium]